MIFCSIILNLQSIYSNKRMQRTLHLNCLVYRYIAKYVSYVLAKQGEKESTQSLWYIISITCNTFWKKVCHYTSQNVEIQLFKLRISSHNLHQTIRGHLPSVRIQKKRESTKNHNSITCNTFVVKEYYQQIYSLFRLDGLLFYQ